MLYLCNYADYRYIQQQKLNTQSAYEKGKVDKVIEFHEEDIQELKKAFPEHFKITRGGGLWLWKPYICVKALEQLQDGDYLFYCDTGAVFIDDLHQMIPDLEASGKDILLVEQSLLSRQFTKSECYHLMDYHNYEGNQVLSGYILMKKTPTSVSYMQEWFENMKDIRLAYGKKYLPEIPEFKDFVSHREDQSVLDILKYKWGIEGHRDPSDFGIFPWQYMRAGKYSPKEYPNSHYPVILLCVRKNDPVRYEQNYYRALKLHRWGLNNAFIARLKLMPMYCRHWGKMFLKKNNITKSIKKCYLYLLKRKIGVWQFFLWQEKRIEQKDLLPHYLALTQRVDAKMPKCILYVVNGWCWGGGIADRFKGIVSLYDWCKENDRDFKIHFTHPFQLNDYLDINKYDWKIKESQICYNTKEIDIKAMLLEPVLAVPEIQNHMQELQETWLNDNLKSNKQIHVYTNMRSGNKHFSERFNELFRPNERLLKLIEANKTHLGEKYISISFRFTTLLGDFNDCTDVILSVEKRKGLIDKCLKAIDNIVQRNKDAKKILVTSDSKTFLDYAANKTNVYIVPGKIGHIDYDYGDDVTMKTFLDFFLISQAQKVYLVKIGKMYNSAFAKTAAMVNNRPFLLYEG